MRSPVAGSAWLLRRPSPRARGRVFCIPHAGSGAGTFGMWPAETDGVEFLAVELPGRLSRAGERLPGTFPELAADLIVGLEPFLDVPFAFYGHCWSALAAYEATVQLENAGVLPRLLVVSSQVAPQDGPTGRMLGMTDDELRVELLVAIEEQGGTPHPELVDFYLRILRDDVEVSRRYVVPRPQVLRTPVTSVGWRDDTEVPWTAMAGWARCGRVRQEVLPGGHLEFMRAPRALVTVLASSLTAG